MTHYRAPAVGSGRPTEGNRPNGSRFWRYWQTLPGLIQALTPLILGLVAGRRRSRRGTGPALIIHAGAAANCHRHDDCQRATVGCLISITTCWPATLLARTSRDHIRRAQLRYQTAEQYNLLRWGPVRKQRQYRIRNMAQFEHANCRTMSELGHYTSEP